MQVKCPSCQWKPATAFRWVCTGGNCGHAWNTFDTGGVCPECSKIWDETFCYECKTMQPHVDWYHDDGRAQTSADELIDRELATGSAESDDD